MVDSKWSERREKHLESNNNCQPRRKASKVERILHEYARKPSVKHWQIYPKIINGQLDIKLGQFTEKELAAVLKRKLKEEKLLVSTKFSLKFENQENLMTYFSDYVTIINKTIEKWIIDFIPSFPKKGDPEILKIYWSIILTSITAKVYNTLLLNRIRPEIEKYLRKIKNGFRRNRSPTSQIQTIKISKEYEQRISRQNYCS